MSPSPTRPSTPLLALLAALAVAGAAGCTGPTSRPATGEVADAVRASLASGTATFDHAGWDALLAAGTEDGLVDYRLFQERRGELDAYLERVAAADLAGLDGDHLMALLINAYNAYTMLSILEHPEVSSIREISGVWTEAEHPVGGFPLTLDAMEHNLLRPFWQDPRIHFAVNCASMSCAPLSPWAFTGEEIEAQLEERSRAFLSSPDNVAVEGEALRVSKYFDWYGDDFVAEGWEPRAETIPAFVARYSRDEVRAFVAGREEPPELRFFDYDWSLNAAVPPAVP